MRFLNGTELAQKNLNHIFICLLPRDPSTKSPGFVHEFKPECIGLQVWSLVSHSLSLRPPEF